MLAGLRVEMGPLQLIWYGPVFSRMRTSHSYSFSWMAVVFKTRYCGFSLHWILHFFPLSVRASVTCVTPHISHIYTGINAMLIIRGPIKPYIFWIKIILAIFLAKNHQNYNCRILSVYIVLFILGWAFGDGFPYLWNQFGWTNSLDCPGWVGWGWTFVLQTCFLPTSHIHLSPEHFLSMCSFASELKRMNKAHIATMSKPHGMWGKSKSGGSSI